MTEEILLQNNNLKNVIETKIKEYKSHSNTHTSVVRQTEKKSNKHTIVLETNHFNCTTKQYFIHGMHFFRAPPTAAVTQNNLG